MNLEAFPLHWPTGQPRTRNREQARFAILDANRHRKELTKYIALNRLTDELNKLEATDVVVSTNVPLRQDGLLYSGAREPDDPGVAVYFRLDGVAHCLPCDKWDRVADNLAAIAAHIATIRAQGRYGVGDIKQAFAGWKSLPAMPSRPPWWVLLGFVEPPESLPVVRTRWLGLVKKYHPDTEQGDADKTAEINAAFTEAEKFYVKQTPNHVELDEEPVEKPKRRPSSLMDRFRQGA